MSRYSLTTLVVAAVVVVAVVAQPVIADGSETLGPPSISIDSGTDIIAKGTGMLTQPGTIDLNIPAGASVEQVLLYWEGFGFSATNDDTITISNGIVSADVTGTLIGGPDFFYSDKYSSTFRADITDLALVGPGANTLTLSGMDFDPASNGAGVLVIIDDGSGLAELQILDGNDLAFINFAPPRDTTVPQTFSFPSFTVDRTATFTMFFSSVQGPASSGGPIRPTTILIDVDGTVTSVNNQLGSFDGNEWDTLVATVAVPAGADNITIQALSEDNMGTGALPASFVWSAAGLAILPGPTVEIEKFTNGYDADDPDGFPIPTPPDGEFLVGLNQVPLVGIGEPVTWTYRVTNTGPEPLVNVMVSDSQGVTVTCPQDTLAPGEEMTCTAMGSGLDLPNTPGTVPGCTGDGQGQPRPSYENIGTVVGQGEVSFIEVTNDDPSHYCNPEDPAIEIEKATNGVDADAPDGGDVPQIAPGDTVTWSYVVTNVGTVRLVDVQAFDDTLGVTLDCPMTTLEPGESMICSSISSPAMQLGFGDPDVVPGTCGGIPERPLYENIARATGESEIGTFVQDDDPSHYCNPPDEPIGCRVTTGLNDIFGADDGDNRYHAGGQAGAHTALPPQPFGEWTHTQQRGPAGRFTFHGGTASAPEGTEIDAIRCSDPGGCSPSGNPPSPAKQLDFDGIGTFKNLGHGSNTPDFVQSGANATAEGNGNQAFDGTFHWFEVNLDDLGEPGNTNPGQNPGDADTDLCPLTGFGENGALPLAECSCSDFYRITIYDGVNAADIVKNPDGSIDPSQLNRTDVIYQVWGYIDGGNLQIHQLTGFDQ